MTDIEILKNEASKKYDEYIKLQNQIREEENKVSKNWYNICKETFIKHYIDPLKNIDDTYWISYHEGETNPQPNFTMYHIKSITNKTTLLNEYDILIRTLNSPCFTSESDIFRFINICNFYHNMPEFYGLEVYYSDAYGSLKANRIHFETSDAIFWPTFINSYTQISKDEFNEKLNWVKDKINNI